MMGSPDQLIAFGPIPSRRLGKSLGVNNIPPKSCTYSCVYCQVGRTSDMSAERREFYSPERVFREVSEKVSGARREGEAIDYLTFVPDGEPTLDINLGKEIDMLRPLGIKIAVITNASLIWDRSVRDDLCRADWVSVKVDAVTESAWRAVNRPMGSLDLGKILDGISSFSREFKGDLATETMLVRGVNDSEREMERTADLISGLPPHKSYISIPTRPPAESEVRPADESAINRAYQIFVEKGIDTEYLIGYEGDAFAFTGDLRRDILSITAVHPMKEEAVFKLVDRAGAERGIVKDLLDGGELTKVRYRGEEFYVRKV